MRFFITVFLIITAQSLFAQKYATMDASPMDLASFKKGGETIAKVYYSRPQKNGRQVFGKLVKYGKVWRLGANENTEISFATDVKIGGQLITAGTYALFAIPNEKEWTIILSNETDKWGHFFYNDKDDAARIKLTVANTTSTVEAFTMAFDKTKSGAILYMAWDNVQVGLPIEIVSE